MINYQEKNQIKNRSKCMINYQEDNQIKHDLQSCFSTEWPIANQPHRS